jgi:hypothetical protein
MANQYIDTGHGATITFGTSALAFNTLSIGLGTPTRAAIDKTHLGTTGQREFMAGDLEDAGEMSVNFQFDPGATAPVTSTAAETVTVTFPLTTGAATAATYAGTGLITSVQLPELATETIQTGTLTVKWDGMTGPTFTAHAET